MGIVIDLWLNTMNAFSINTLKNFTSRIKWCFDKWKDFVMYTIRREQDDHRVQFASDKDIYITNKIFYKIKAIQNKNKKYV